MRIERLSVTCFRNLHRIEIEPSGGLNLLLGNNGQGKTSVLEAISLLASLRSFRDSKPQDWIQFGALSSQLDSWISPDQASQRPTNEWKSHFQVLLQKDPLTETVRKTALVNGKRAQSGAGYLKQKFGSAELAFHAICFNPGDHDLIRGEPAVRRAYLDRVIAAEDSDYLEKTLQYSRLVDQRNALLKERAGRYQGVLFEFTYPLIQLGATLLLARLRWLEKNLKRVQKEASRIASNNSQLGLLYLAKGPDHRSPRIVKKNNEIGILNGVHFAGHHPLPSLEVIENWLKSRFEANQAEELRQGVTLLGPHRDDWAIEHEGASLKGTGSQGEVRTALLALKLTEISSFREVTGHRPVLLLDDFSSELDLRRRRFLMESIEETDLQVFVTSTEASGLPGKVFRVEKGQVTPDS
ncbi:MAG: DNA replication/repair protein RecF [Oligoflexia bacterium]